MLTLKEREQEVAYKEKRWNKEKSILQRELDLKDEKRQFIAAHSPKTTTNKKLIWFLFLNCTLIELFVGYVTIKSFSLAIYTSCNPDFTPLVTLVGAVVSEVIGYAVYAAKAAKENTVGGITYDMAMLQQAPPIEDPILDPNEAKG